MDTTSSFYTRHMLLQYGRQLISSRRLARYNQLMGLGGSGPGDPPPNEQRRLMVERISREVVDNLIFSGSENPVVLEVRQRLEDSLGKKLIFQYPPGEFDFKIILEEKSGPVEISGDEKHKIMGRLLDITRQTVEETML